MWGTLLGVLLMLAAFVVFGSLGGMLGDKLERDGTGQNLAPGCMVVFGVIGVALTMWIVSLFTGK
jgi:hypothetical protein